MPNSAPLIDAAFYGRLGTLIYTYPTTGTAVYSGTLGAYNTLAPQSSAPPYTIFQMSAAVDEYAFGGNGGESFDYLLKSVSLKNYPSQEANPIYEQSHVAIQDAPFSVTGYKVHRVRRTSQFRYRDNGGYWHVGGLYRVDITKE